MALVKSDARTKRIIAAAGASYLGRFGQGIAVLVNLPLARESLNSELFGVWMMLSALLGFMGFADLGIGNGVLNQTTKAKATNDRELLQRVLSAGYAITGTVGCLLFLAWFAWAKLSYEPTALAGAISAHNQPEVLKALSFFAIILAVNIPASLVQRVQLGAQQGYLNGLNQLIYAMLTLIMVPLTLHWGGSVSELVLATIGVQVLVNILNSIIWLQRHGMSYSHNWIRSLDLQTAKSLLKASSMFFLLQLAAALAFQSDVIVITQTLGQSAYGDFAVVQKLFLFISMLMSAAMLGLWPAFGDALASNQKAWAMVALKRGMIAAAVITLLGVSALSAGMPWILKYWMNSAVQPMWGLIFVLAVWTVIDSVANVAAAFMNGANILRPQLVIAVSMGSAAFGAKWLLTPSLGPTGAVLATILTYCLISVPGQVYLLRKAFNTKEYPNE